MDQIQVYSGVFFGPVNNVPILRRMGIYVRTYIEIQLRGARQKYYYMLVLVGMNLVTPLPAIDFLSLMFTGNTTN